jgi:hypothetical protein
MYNANKRPSVESILEGVINLPDDLHGAGSVSASVLRGIYRYGKEMNITLSVETGCGKTTLLFSHLSRHHQVFSVDGGKSITVVRDSPLLNKESFELIEGPTQVTLPAHKMSSAVQLAYLDGPHGFPFPDLEYYYVYPHLERNGLLIVDDIHIPTIYNLFRFLKEDEMFEELEVIDTTAFFRRTAAQRFDPYADGWWLQKYNKNRFPVPINSKLRIKSYLPKPMKNLLRRFFPKKRG